MTGRKTGAARSVGIEVSRMGLFGAHTSWADWNKANPMPPPKPPPSRITGTVVGHVPTDDETRKRLLEAVGVDNL